MILGVSQSKEKKSRKNLEMFLCILFVYAKEIVTLEALDWGFCLLYINRRCDLAYSCR